MSEEIKPADFQVIKTESVRLIDDSINRTFSELSSLLDLRFKMATASTPHQVVRLLSALAMRLFRQPDHQWAIESCVTKAQHLGELIGGDSREVR